MAAKKKTTAKDEQAAAARLFDAEKELRKLQRAVRARDKAEAELKDVRVATKATCDAAFAKVADLIEAGIPEDVPGAERDQLALGKLQRVEGAWQDWNEAKAERSTKCSDARDKLSAARSKLADLVDESKQPRLPGTA